MWLTGRHQRFLEKAVGTARAVPHEKNNKKTILLGFFDFLIFLDLVPLIFS